MFWQKSGFLPKVWLQPVKRGLHAVSILWLTDDLDGFWPSPFLRGEDGPRTPSQPQLDCLKRAGICPGPSLRFLDCSYWRDVWTLCSAQYHYLPSSTVKGPVCKNKQHLKVKKCIANIGNFFFFFSPWHPTWAHILLLCCDVGVRITQSSQLEILFL